MFYRLIKHRNLILLLWLCLIALLAGAAGFGLSDGLTPDHSIVSWSRESDPVFRDISQYNTQFDHREWAVAQLHTAAVTNPAFLQDLAALTTELEALALVKRVISLTNARDNAPGADFSLTRTRLYPKQTLGNPLSADQLTQFKERLRRHPVFQNIRLREGTSTDTVILIQYDYRLLENAPYRPQLRHAIRNLLASYPSILQFRLTGFPPVDSPITHAAHRNLVLATGLLVMALLLLSRVVSGSTRDTLVLFAILVCAGLPALGLALLRPTLSAVTFLLPLLLVVLSGLHGIHLIQLHAQERQIGNGKAAPQRCFQLARVPVVCTTLVTGGCFLLLTVLSHAAPLRELAGLATLSSGLAALAALTLAPILLMEFHHSSTVYPPRSWPGSHRLRALLPERVRRPIPLFTGLTVILLLAVVGVTRISLDNRAAFFGQRPSDTTAREPFKATRLSQAPLHLVMTFPKGRRYTDYFSDILAFESRLRQHPQVTTLVTLSDQLRSLDQAINGEQTHRPPLESYSSMALSLLLFVADSTLNNDLKDLTRDNLSVVQTLIFTDQTGTESIQALHHTIAKIKQSVLPEDVTVTLVGSAVLFSAIHTRALITTVTALLLAGGSLFLLLPLLLRSLPLGLLGAIASGVPVILTLGVMGWTGRPMNLATGFAAAIALGISVDATVSFLVRFQDFRHTGYSWAETIKHTVHASGSRWRTLLLTLGLAGIALLIPGSPFSFQVGFFMVFTLAGSGCIHWILLPGVLGMFTVRMDKNRIVNPGITIRFKNQSQSIEKESPS